MLLAYYCNTQKQSFEEFAKFIGKQLCQSPFLKRDSNTVIFKNTSGRLLWKLILFYIFFFVLTVLYTHFRNNWNFSRRIYFSNNWAFYTMEPRYIILMNLATERNSDCIDKVFIQPWTLLKLETFHALFKVCVI